MAANREVGGVALGFVGFVFLTMAFKGTWTNVWGALLGHPTGKARKGAGATSSAQQASYTFGPGGVAGRPGGAVAPSPSGGSPPLGGSDPGTWV